MPEERYIDEMPLVVTPRQAKVLDQRFEAARMIYNAALQEGLKRLRLMRESKDWNKARALKKAGKKKKLTHFIAMSVVVLSSVTMNCKRYLF